MTKVLFACVHNAGRSQMAAAWFNALAAPEVATAVSAGTQPATRVHPEVAAAMAELGIDLTACQPRLLTEELARTVDVLVTMGCGETCPVVPGARRIDWQIPDPKGQPLDEVRRIRGLVEERVRELVEQLGASRPDFDSGS